MPRSRSVSCSSKQRFLMEQFALDYYLDITRQELAKAGVYTEKVVRIRKNVDKLRQECVQLKRDYSCLQKSLSRVDLGTTHLKAAVSRYVGATRADAYLSRLVCHLEEVAANMRLVPFIVDADDDKEEQHRELRMLSVS